MTGLGVVQVACSALDCGREGTERSVPGMLGVTSTSNKVLDNATWESHKKRTIAWAQPTPDRCKHDH